ncbi:hypothetical protein [Massilia sp. Bi118]|uniref:hypothetical protein n=1 Tax=Massilia sp. Bi118 TaxID=2822346 RepID=UPI001E5E8EFE|nr:hypothetical protein [Massilia sp. Bi118]
MKKLALAVLAAMAVFSLAYAAKPWDGSYAAFRGEYLIYSGDLGEEAAPTSSDRKAAFMLQGDVAKNLFESIGPDLKDACGTSSGMRLRQKGDLDCTYDKGAKSSPYVCHFGINLRTGKSTYGSIC